MLQRPYRFIAKLLVVSWITDEQIINLQFYNGLPFLKPLDESHIDFIEITIISCDFSDFKYFIKYMNIF